jgi:hypothetical protein
MAGHMKTLLFAMLAMLMLAEAPASEAAAADACEATIEIIAPAPQGVVPAPLSELTPFGRLSLADADPPFEPSGRVTILRKETVSFPSPGGPVRHLDLGNGRTIELRHFAGRRPEWAELGSDGKLSPDSWRRCPLYAYTGLGWHRKGVFGTLSIHQPGPIQEPPSQASDADALAGPAVVAADSCEATIEIIVPVPDAQHFATSRVNELSPLAQRALAKQESPWEASGLFHLAGGSGQTVPFPPVGQVRDIDLHSPYSTGIELRHLAGQRPDFVMLGVDGKPTSSPPVQCPTKYYEGFTLPQEDRLTVVRIHPPGPIEEPPASEARNRQ